MFEVGAIHRERYTMRVHWDCGLCGKKIEHRWEGDRLVFACVNSKESHFFEKQITTVGSHKVEIWAWAIPIIAMAGIVFVLF